MFIVRYKGNVSVRFRFSFRITFTGISNLKV